MEVLDVHHHGVHGLSGLIAVKPIDVGGEEAAGLLLDVLSRESDEPVRARQIRLQYLIVERGSV